MTIAISGMRKRFGGTEVLRGVDLDVRQGELVALLGPSGSGKTTLLKIVAGLEWPDQGALSVNGEDWLRLGPRDRRTGFVFQHYALFPHMSVRDNVAFGLTVRPRSERPSRGQIAARVDALLAFLQIAPLADRFPAQLSGGQRQRVALGRALAIEPAVLLLDEPFGALDAAVRRDLRAWLRGVHDATGSTTVFVTHDQEEAFDLADRVVVMGEGRIEQVGSESEIQERPASPFVARFTGATVEIPVALRAGRVEAAGLDAGRLERRALPDGPARLFLRPSDLTPVADPSGPWRIADLSATGPMLRAVLSGPGGLAATAEVPRRSTEARALQVGAAVRLRPEAGAVFPEFRAAVAPAAETPAQPRLMEIAR
jgi:sulfate transport system ATP-binding protein